MIDLNVYSLLPIFIASLGISVGASGTLNALQRIVAAQSCGCRRVQHAFAVAKHGEGELPTALNFWISAPPIDTNSGTGSAFPMP